MTDRMTNNVMQPRRFCVTHVSPDCSTAVLNWSNEHGRPWPGGWSVGWWDPDQNIQYQHYDYEFFQQTEQISFELRRVGRSQ